MTRKTCRVGRRYRALSLALLVAGASGALAVSAASPPLGSLSAAEDHRVSRLGEADSLALVALYDATRGDSWSSNANWKSGPVSSWFGVISLSGKVVGLNLSNNGLSGIIPSELGDLVDLQSLRLPYNQLVGSIPTDIGRLVELSELDLSWNELSGAVPPAIGNLSSFIDLELIGNQTCWLSPEK